MRTTRPIRRIAIAIPAHNEAAAIGPCLDKLAWLQTGRRVGVVDIVVLANNCDDDTAARAGRATPGPGQRIHVESVRLPPERAHAGWARRLALETAAARLRAPWDVLASTDADTLPAPDWLERTLDHLDAGWDAVAGQARLNPRELRRLEPAHRARLAAIQKYENALDFLKARRTPEEPWPRHFYEGGASMAVTLELFRRIGEPPTPRVGEDKAFFDAVRRHGGRVRHATDVRVTTSARLDGRARGGASDTLSIWGRQGADEPIHELRPLAASLRGGEGDAGVLTFSSLPAETARARAMVRAARRRHPMALAS